MTPDRQALERAARAYLAAYDVESSNSEMWYRAVVDARDALRAALDAETPTPPATKPEECPPTPAEGRGEEALSVGSPAHVALWDSINAYAAACGGHTEGAGSVDRMLAVARIENAIRSLPHGDGGGKGAK